MSCGTVAVPTLSSTEATLTQTEAGVGNAACHHGTGILLRVANVGCFLVGSWPSARHDKAQWLGPTQLLVVARSRLWGAWAWHRASSYVQGNVLEVQCWLRWHSLDRRLDHRGKEEVPIPHIGAAGEPDRARISVNPLFSLPAFSVELICIDMLHSKDLGVTQDAIGNLFVERVAGHGGTQVAFNFLHVCLRLCACVCVCVRLCSACPVVCCLLCRPWALPRAVEERPDC